MDCLTGEGDLGRHLPFPPPYASPVAVFCKTVAKISRINVSTSTCVIKLGSFHEASAISLGFHLGDPQILNGEQVLST